MRSCRYVHASMGAVQHAHTHTHSATCTHAHTHIRDTYTYLQSYFGIHIGGWNQSYLYDTLPQAVESVEELLPGDLIFTSGIIQVFRVIQTLVHACIIISWAKKCFVEVGRVFVFVFVFVRVNILAYIHLHVPMCVSIYMSMYACVCVFLCVSVHNHYITCMRVCCAYTSTSTHWCRCVREVNLTLTVDLTLTRNCYDSHHYYR